MTVANPNDQPQRAPKDLGNGLIMRWSTRADAKNLGDLIAESFKYMSFAGPIPDDEYPAPNEILGAAGRRLVRGNHVVMTEFDYALVEDTTVLDSSDQNPIVACIGLHVCPGYYGSTPIMMHKPELIATNAKYRNQGLVRHLFYDMIHPECEERNSILQFIPGIKYFYRQFGYEYALTTFKGVCSLENPKTSLKGLFANEYQASVTLRKATVEDIPFLVRQDEVQFSHTPASIGLLHDEHCWRFLIKDCFETAQSKYDVGRVVRIIVDQETGKDLGVITLSFMGKLSVEMFSLDTAQRTFIEVYQTVLMQAYEVGKEFFSPPKETSEAAVTVDAITANTDVDGQVVETLEVQEETKKEDKQEAGEEEGPKRDPFAVLGFNLGSDHPVLKLVGSSLKVESGPGFRLYTRIPSYPAFIRAVQPELEKRLADSPLAGITAKVQLDFYKKVEGTSGKGIEIVFEKGKLVSVQDWVKPSQEAMVPVYQELKKLGKKRPLVLSTALPPYGFHLLLTGARSLAEINDSFSETFMGNDQNQLMINTLFPKVNHNFDIFWW